MAKKKVEVELPERSALEALAKEMNEVMGLDPKIKFNRKTTDEELVAMIRENAVDEETGETVIYGSDFEEDSDDPEKVVFTEDAGNTLDLLDLEIGDEPEDDAEPEPEPEPVKKGKKAEKEVEKPAAKKGKKVEKEEEPEVEEEKPAKKSAKKEVEEKPAAKKKDEKEEKKPAKKAEKTAKYGRADSIADAIVAARKSKKGITYEGLNDASCDLYDKENNEKTARPYSNSWLKSVLTIMVALEVAELKSEKYTFN